MTVESFDPSNLGAPVTVETARELLATAELSDDGIDLNPADRARFAAAVTAPSWTDIAAELTAEEVEGLIRIFTLGERDFAGWQAGARSAVIPLVAELKGRGVFDKMLGRWVKAHTDNRFLPHGNLMDRL